MLRGSLFDLPSYLFVVVIAPHDMTIRNDCRVVNVVVEASRSISSLVSHAFRIINAVNPYWSYGRLLLRKSRVLIAINRCCRCCWCPRLTQTLRWSTSFQEVVYHAWLACKVRPRCRRQSCLSQQSDPSDYCTLCWICCLPAPCGAC